MSTGSNGSVSVQVFEGSQGGVQAYRFLQSRVAFISSLFEVKPLWQIAKDWVFKGEVFGRHDGAFFQLIGGIFNPGGREVAGWAQPLLQEIGPPHVAALFVFDPGEGKELQFLLQAVSEPGSVGVVVEDRDDILQHFVDDKRGEIVQALVGGLRRWVLLSSVLGRTSIQASSANIERHALNVPLVTTYRRLAEGAKKKSSDEGYVVRHGLPQPQDPGRFFRKVVTEEVFFLTAAQRDELNQEVLNPPQVPVNGKEPDGPKKPAFSGDNFFWADESAVRDLERHGALNHHVVSLVGRAVRLRGREPEPSLAVQIVASK